MFLRSICFAVTVFCLGFQAHALTLDGTFIIPQQEKIQRFGHNTGAAAARSDRRTVGANLSSSKTKSEVNGTKTTETRETSLTPYAYYNFGNGVVAELNIDSTKSKEKSFPGGTSETTKTRDMQIRGGYLIPNTQFAVGVELGNTAEKNDPTDTDTSTIGLSASLKIDEALLVGAGISRDKEEVDDGTTETTNSKDDSYFVGLGILNGDSGKVRSAFETVLGWQNEEGVKTYSSFNQYLMNFDESSQLKVTFIWAYQDEPSTHANIKILGARYDHQYSNKWYIAPELELRRLDLPGGIDSKVLEPAIEVGMREASYTFFGRLSHSNTSSDLGAIDAKIKGPGLELGGQYYF